MVHLEVIKKRIEQIKGSLARSSEGGTLDGSPNIHGSIQSAISIISLIYGENSVQMKRFLEISKIGAAARDAIAGVYEKRMVQQVKDFLDSALADLEAGLTGSIQIHAKGEVLGDFVSLSREALNLRNDQADRVAAVLAAAALEETLKQLGQSKDVDVYNRDMRGVIQKLKDANILVGPQAGIASGFVKFRDAAFHGQFDQIDRPATESALTFVEGLLSNTFV
jgi:hypothetical protein